MTEKAASLQSPYRGWSLFFCGVCMGIADLVPGISGGTIAFIMGFYQPLLESIKTLNLAAFKLLVKGQWRQFSAQVAWTFLLTLLAGIGFAVAALANLFHFILAYELYRIYLYAAFFGLILASFFFCIRQINEWKGSTVVSLFTGAFAAYLLTDTLSPFTTEAIIELGDAGLIFSGWLCLCGALAVCALLLPGISGSYILMLLGVYPLVIQALAVFIKEAANLSFHAEAFSILSSLGLGVVLGALAFARVLSYLLRRFPNQSIALLSGFIIGAIRSVWPFWTQAAAAAEQPAQLVSWHPYVPSWDSPLAWKAFLFFAAGVMIVWVIEVVRATGDKKN